MKRNFKITSLIILFAAFTSFSAAFFLFLNKTNYYKPLCITLNNLNFKNEDDTINVLGITPLNRIIPFKKDDIEKNKWTSAWGFLKEIQIIIPQNSYSDSLIIEIETEDECLQLDKSKLLNIWHIEKKANQYVFITSVRFSEHAIFNKILSVFHWKITHYILLLFFVLLFFYFIIKYRAKALFIIKKINQKKGVRIITYFIFLIIITEISLRILGFKPHNIYTVYTHYVKQKTHPFLFCTDKVLGNVLKTGSFISTIDNNYFYTATIGNDSSRITRPQDKDSLYNKKPVIAIMGCSVTFGVGLDDSLTFPWLIQENMPSYNVRNYGVPGFGTLQMLLKLQELITENKKPEKVFVMYFSGHDQRNSLNRSWQRVCYDASLLNTQHNEDNMQTNIFFPYARLNKKHIELKYRHFIKDKNINKRFYRAFPFSRFSALANFFETIINSIDEKCISSKEVSKKIFALFKLICCKHEIELTVVGFNKDKNTVEMLAYCTQTGIDTLLMDIDLNDINYNLLPLDRHPNTKANKYFSDKIIKYLNEGK